MGGDPARAEQLTFAASFCLFDRKLRSSGNASIVWGLINALIGVSVLTRNKWGAVSLIFGIALIVAGLYERKVRDPRVILISAATLAGLALWEIGLVIFAVLGKGQLALGGRPLFWAIAQGWGAFSTWKTYSTYTLLHEKSDPVTVQQVRGYIDDLKKAKPAQSVDLIEFEANAGFLEGTKRYRLKPVEDFYLVAKYKAQLGTLQLETVDFVPRAQVTLLPEGEKWMSKKIKATVQMGPVILSKVTVTPEMAERINPAARVIALGTLPT